MRVVTGVMAPAQRATRIKVVEMKSRRVRRYGSGRLQVGVGVERLLHRWRVCRDVGVWERRRRVE